MMRGFDLPEPHVDAVTRDDRSLSPNFLLVLGVFAGAGLSLSLGWLLGLCFHEGAHAWAAVRFGDDGSHHRPHLALDPVSFTDPLGTFLLPLVFLLGGFFVLPGARVYVDLGAIRRRLHRSLVYLAGPAANFAFLVVLAIFHAFLSDDVAPELRASIVLMAWLQASSVVINLLPVPSFDGFGAIEQWLPDTWRPDGLTRDEEARLEDVGALISAAERRAMAAERDTVDRLIAAHLAERVDERFDARISGVTKAGLFVQLPQYGADGFIPVSTLQDDYYIYDETARSLFGERTGKGYQLADRVEVRLVEVAPMAGAMRFEMLSEPKPLPGSTRSFHKTRGRTQRARASQSRHGRPGGRRR